MNLIQHFNDELIIFDVESIMLVEGKDKPNVKGEYVLQIFLGFSESANDFIVEFFNSIDELKARMTYFRKYKSTTASSY